MYFGGIISTSLAQVETDIFAQRSLILKSCHKFKIRLRSGLWMGFQTHVCLGLLSYWNVNLYQEIKSFVTVKFRSRHLIVNSDQLVCLLKRRKVLPLPYTCTTPFNLRDDRLRIKCSRKKCIFSLWQWLSYCHSFIKNKKFVECKFELKISAVPPELSLVS